MKGSNVFSEISCTKECDRDVKEIINGSVVMMSPTSPKHNRLVRRLANLLEEALPSMCEVYTESVALDIPVSLKKSPKDYVQPDVMVLCNPEWNGSKAKTIPTLVIEVLSESKESEIIRDTKVKRKLYEAMGVKEYLIVSQDGFIITCRLNKSNKYEVFYNTLGLSEGVVFKSEYLSGFEVDIDKLYNI